MLNNSEENTPQTPTKQVTNVKRERSPARLFLASPSARTSKKMQINFSDNTPESSNANEIDLLCRNLFGTTTSSQKRNIPQDHEVYSDRYIPCRESSNLGRNIDISDDTDAESLASPKDEAGVIGVSVSNLNNTPSSQHSSGSNPSPSHESPQRIGHSAYSSLLRSELLGLDEDETQENVNYTPTESSFITPRRHTRTAPRMPATPQKGSVFRYKAVQRKALEFNSMVSSHSLSPLTSFSTINPYSSFYENARSTRRKINKTPFKILDAPGLTDDYYLNLVDWSSTNQLAVGLGNNVYLWNAATAKVTLLADLQKYTNSSNLLRDGQATSVAWSVDGTQLATGTSAGIVHIWDIETQKKIRSLDGHGARVGSLAWSHGHLASGSRDRKILRRDIRAQNSTFGELIGHKQEVCGLKWSFDGTQLASGGNDNRLLVWDCSSTTPIWDFNKYHEAAVKAVAWSPHQSGLLASGGGTADRCIRFWNTLTGTPLNYIDTGCQVCNMSWSKNVNEIVSTHGYSLNHIIVWKYPSMTKVTTLTSHTSRVLYLAVSPDGETAVTGAGDEKLCFWNLFPSSKSKAELKNRGSILMPTGFDIR